MKLSEIFVMLVNDDFSGQCSDITVAERPLSLAECGKIMDSLEQYCSDVGGGGDAMTAINRGVTELDNIERFHDDIADHARKKARAAGKNSAG